MLHRTSRNPGEISLRLVALPKGGFEPCEDHTFVVENKPDAGISIAAATLRAKLAEIEAKFRRDKEQLERAIAAEEDRERRYLRMSHTEAIETYIGDNPRQEPYLLIEVVNALKKVGLSFGKGGKRPGDAHSVAKGLVKQHHNPPRFIYDEDTDIISLAEPDETDPATPKKRTKGRRR